MSRLCMRTYLRDSELWDVGENCLLDIHLAGSDRYAFGKGGSAYARMMIRAEYNIPMGVFLSKKLQAMFSHQRGHAAQLL